jgi:hypothetical protein
VGDRIAEVEEYRRRVRKGKNLASMVVHVDADEQPVADRHRALDGALRPGREPQSPSLLSCRGAISRPGSKGFAALWWTSCMTSRKTQITVLRRMKSSGSGCAVTGRRPQQWLCIKWIDL